MRMTGVLIYMIRLLTDRRKEMSAENLLRIEEIDRQIDELGERCKYATGQGSYTGIRREINNLRQERHLDF